SRAAVRLFFPDTEKAEQAVPAVQDLMVFLRIGLGGMLISKLEERAEEAAPGKESEQAEFLLLCAEELGKAVRQAPVEQKGATVDVGLELKFDTAALRAKARERAAKRAGDPKAREARDRRASANNLKEIVLALITFADTYNRRLPPPAICSKDGK